MDWTTSINQELLPAWEVALMGAGIFIGICTPMVLMYLGQKRTTLTRQVTAEERLERDDTSLDVLRREDLVLRDLFAQLRADQALIEVVDVEDGDPRASVVRRYEYGDRARQTLRHLAVHQSAATDVASGVSSVSALQGVASEIVERSTASRPLMNELRGLSSHVDPESLNDGQDFDGRLTQLMDMTADAIDFELAEAIPAIEDTLDPARRRAMLRSGRYVSRHAPTKLNPTGPRRYERAPVISRALTVWDHFAEV